MTKKDKATKPLRVVELFAGVGGFRIGLEGPPGGPKNDSFRIAWSNQWEPSTKKQHAFEIYQTRFGESHCCSNKDISQVEIGEIPVHDLLVGGFPCQDYSVARTLSQASGIIGKKGVLWWQIHRILSEIAVKPKYLLLENVDRLLKSPASQRGRDFAIMLASLSDLGYAVEWRVVNAADYGMPQKRRRVFFLGYHKSSSVFRKISKPIDWILKDGVMGRAFPIVPSHALPLLNLEEGLSIEPMRLDGNLVEITRTFNQVKPALSPFKNTGIMIKRKVWTISTKPDYQGACTLLGDVLQPESEIPEEYYLDLNELSRWEYLKNSKSEPRTNGAGYTFNYVEGPLPFPDPLDRPARTIITSEGGKTPSRFKHVVEVIKNRKRRLTPVELERLNMFPDNHTAGLADTKRAFIMGNALVVGVIEKIGQSLAEAIGGPHQNNED